MQLLRTLLALAISLALALLPVGAFAHGHGDGVPMMHAVPTQHDMTHDMAAPHGARHHMATMDMAAMDMAAMDCCPGDEPASSPSDDAGTKCPMGLCCVGASALLALSATPLLVDVLVAAVTLPIPVDQVVSSPDASPPFRPPRV